MDFPWRNVVGSALGSPATSRVVRHQLSRPVPLEYLTPEQPGSNSAIVVLPAQGYVIVGLANVDPDAIGNVVNYIARRVPL